MFWFHDKVSIIVIRRLEPVLRNFLLVGLIVKMLFRSQIPRWIYDGKERSNTKCLICRRFNRVIRRLPGQGGIFFGISKWTFSMVKRHNNIMRRLYEELQR